MNNTDLSVIADLLEIDFKSMYVRWGSHSPARTGVHASAILVPEKDWCSRELVLLNLYPESAEQGEWNHWDWKKSAIFENGWDLHRRWQRVFKKFAKVVYSPVKVGNGIAEDTSSEPLDMSLSAPELDLTHYDADRNLYFSPDAILDFGPDRYVVEIKGVKQESYEELTDDLEQACQACETVYKAREQANLYMHLLGLSRGIILVENKNTQAFRLWVITSDLVRYLPYRDRIYNVKRDLALARRDPQRLPERVCSSISDPRARKCPMREACFKQPVAAQSQSQEEDW